MNRTTAFLLASCLISGAVADECANWQSVHPEWLWCDSFESSQALDQRYQDYNFNGLGVSTQDAYDGQHSLRQAYIPGQVDAGWISRVDHNGFPDRVYFRWYHKFEGVYSSFPPKMARAGYRNFSTWQEVFRVHTWVENGTPVLDVMARNSSQGVWQPEAVSGFDLHAQANQWVAFEVEIKLNTPGQTDGHYRLWINDTLYVERTSVDLRGSTQDPINEIMLDTYWNDGASSAKVRYFDNFVISTARIGLLQSTSIAAPNPPSSLEAARSPQ